MVARAVVLLLVTLQLSPQGHIVDHTGDIDVGQPVGKLVHVDVVVVDAVVDHRLPLDPRLARPRRESEVRGRLQLFPLSPIGKKMGRKLGVGAEGYLLLKGVEEDPGGVLKEEGGVGQQERLLVRARESKRGSLC